MPKWFGAAAMALLPVVAGVAMPGAAVAEAPRLIGEGDSITAAIGAANPRTSNDLAYVCYVLDAPAGSAWEIDFKGERPSRIWVGRGKACDAVDSWDLEASGSGGFIGTTAWSRARFVSGGGAYIVIARFIDGKEGAYILDVSKSAGGGRRLKAAPALQQVAHQEAPAASTATRAAGDAGAAVTLAATAPAPAVQAGPPAPATTVVAEAHTPANVSGNLSSEALEKRWGALWHFAGKDLVCTCDPNRITLVRWETPGEVLHMIGQNEYGTNVAVFRIGPDGRGTNDSYWVTIEKDGTLTPQLNAGNSRSGAEFDRPWTVDAEGSVVVSAGTPEKPTSFRYRIDGGQLTQDSNRKGQWAVVLTNREIASGDLKAERLAATLRQRARLQPPGTVRLADAAKAAPSSQEIVHRDATPAPDVQTAQSAPPASSPMPAVTLAVARGPVEPLKIYPQDGTIPSIQLGQEAVGDVRNGKKFRRMAVPVPVYKFTGRKGQRICARADSTDGNAQVQIGRLSKQAVSPIWAGILPYDFVSRDRGSSVLVTLPADGDYYLYAVVKPWSFSLEPNRTPLSSGRYEMKLWDADSPEPPSISPLMAARPSAAAGEGSLGIWDQIAARPFVSNFKTLSEVTKNPDGSFIYRFTGFDGSVKEETHYRPTGQRGVFRSADQRIAEIQCDGSVILYLDQGRSRFVRYQGESSGSILIQNYTLKRPAQVYAFAMSQIGFPIDVTHNTLRIDSSLGRRQAAQQADLWAYARQQEEKNAREQAAAQRAQDERMGAAFANALGTFADSYADATNDNDRMRQTMDRAVERGIAEGTAIRARREAEEAREEARRRSADAEHARQVREQEEATRQARLAERAQAERARAAEAERADAVQLAARSDSAAGNAASDAGHASTATDATMCVQGPVVGPNPAIKGATLATVINGCPTAIDVRICLMGEGGWDCGTSYGVKPQEKGSYWRSRSSGEIFWDARTSNSDEPLGSPS